MKSVGVPCDDECVWYYCFLPQLATAARSMHTQHADAGPSMSGGPSEAPLAGPSTSRMARGPEHGHHRSSGARDRKELQRAQRNTRSARNAEEGLQCEGLQLHSVSARNRALAAGIVCAAMLQEECGSACSLLLPWVPRIFSVSF